MAISADAGILAMLKTFYAKEGLQNLLYRNDPLLKELKKERIEGKQANFSALYSRGGAVSANFTKAKALAKSAAKAKEFQVVPGQLFSCCSYNAKEILASKTLKGGYINVASAKFFASAESFRKTLAVALYGTGHGELFNTTAVINTTDTTATFPKHAIMGIDIGSQLEAMNSADWTNAPIATIEVDGINGDTVTFHFVGTAAQIPVGSTICLAGCTEPTDGSGMLPVGLAGWLPSGTVATTDDFFGVNRSTARDRLAGSVITRDTANNEKIYEAIERGILALRRMGSLCDKIVMNDEDYLAMSKEIQDKTYFQKVDGGKKGKATVGYDGFGFAVSSNWVESVLDSSYVPKGTVYILSSDVVEMWTYTNTDKVSDGISGNEAGKPEVNGDLDAQNKPYQMLIDDMLSISPDEDQNGAASVVTLNFFGSFVVTNPSVCGVVKI